MKKINKVLLSIGIIVAICIIIVLIILLKVIESNKLHSEDAIIQDNDAVIQDEVISELDGISEYFNLKNCIQLYYTAVANLRYSTSENEVGLGYTENRSG